MNKFELLEIKSKSVADLAGEAAKLLATLEADEFWSETLLTNSEISDGFQTLFDATTKLITGLDECIPGLQQTTLIASLHAVRDRQREQRSMSLNLKTIPCPSM